MINPASRIANMLRGRGAAAAKGRYGLARLTHDHLADLGVAPRPLEDEGPEETAAEGGVEEPVAIAEAPQGQLDVPPQAALPGADPEELDAFPQPFSPAPMTQAAAPVSAPRVDAESDDADELANARANDRTAAIARGFETAGRQLVAGISRTPILDTLTQQTNQAGEVRAAQKSRADKLRMAAEAARQSRETDDKLMNSESSRILDLARAAALNRDIRTGRDPNLDREKLEQKTVADEKLDAREWAKINKQGAKSAGGLRAVDAAPERDVQELAKRTGTAPARMLQGLANLKEMIAKYGEGDLPGIGRFDSLKPDFMQSSDALALQSQSRSLVDELLKKQSGAGVSDKERANTYALYGIGATDERQFRTGFARLEKDIAAELAAEQAGFRPEVVKKYGDRGGTVSVNAPAKQEPGMVEVTHKTGKKKKVSVGAAELLRASGDWK